MRNARRHERKELSLRETQRERKTTGVRLQRRGIMGRKIWMQRKRETEGGLDKCVRESNGCLLKDV